MNQFLIVFAIILNSVSAFATLGEISNKEISQNIKSLPHYSVAQTNSDDNTGLSTLREFKDLDGKVFGVCWVGQRPQKFLAVLLGSHYLSEYKKAISASPAKKGKKFLVARSETFVLKVIDHGRSHRGCAYDPQLVPSGVDANEIK